MIDQIFPFDVAAGALASNFAPTNFNPTPEDGFIMLFGVTDSDDAATALPTIQVILGGTTPGIPAPGSVIPVTEFGTPFAGPNALDELLKPVPVRKGTNMQLNISGGAGAEQTGRLRVIFMTMEEASMSLPQMRGA